MSRLFEMIMVSTGGMTAGGVLLRLVLVVMSVFALLHLLSLWGTRYGDQNTTSKSLFLSLVLHACFGLGWVTVSESYPRRLVGTEPDEKPSPIIIVDAEDVAPESGANKLPIFHSGPATNDLSMSRDPRGLSRTDLGESLEEVASPQMDKGPETSVAPDLPDFVAETEQPAPGLEKSVASLPSAAAASSLIVDDPTAESRPEVVARPVARKTINRPTESVGDAVARPAFQRGISSKVTPFQEDGSSMMLPSEYNMEAVPTQQEIPPSMREVGSRTPVSVVESEPGSGATAPPSNSNMRVPERVVRSTNRSFEGRDDVPSRPSVASLASTTVRTQDDRMLETRGPTETSDTSPQPAFVKPSVPTMSRAPSRGGNVSGSQY